MGAGFEALAARDDIVGRGEYAVGVNIGICREAAGGVDGGGAGQIERQRVRCHVIADAAAILEGDDNVGGRGGMGREGIAIQGRQDEARMLSPPAQSSRHCSPALGGDQMRTRPARKLIHGSGPRTMSPILTVQRRAARSTSRQVRGEGDCRQVDEYPMRCSWCRTMTRSAIDDAGVGFRNGFRQVVAGFCAVQKI